jgi:serine/threonine-protein kinase
MVPRSPPPTHPAPTQIGRYRIVARLGGGGMADVYLGVASGLVGFTKLSVIKVIKPAIATEPEHVSLFLDEARLAAKLNHPNVVQTNEVGEDGGTYYLVMEYLEGQTLRRVLRPEVAGRRGESLPALLRALCDVLAGLHYAHELRDFDGRPLGIVHRDVSPHNVFVTYDGAIKLVDFGIAKAAGAIHLTGAGVLRGKFAYMAPEQARGERVDRRADVYSAGVILWEMLARRRMWSGEHELTILRRLTSGALPSLHEHAPDAPPELVAACERALSLDPADRFATAQHLRAAIEAFLAVRGWHVTASDVGALVSRQFADERAAFQRRLEEAFAAGVIQTVAQPSLSSLRVEASPSGAPSNPGLASGSPSNRGPAARRPSSRPPPGPASPPEGAPVPDVAPPAASAIAPLGVSVPPGERARATALAWAAPFVAGVLVAGSSLHLWRNEPAAATPAPTPALLTASAAAPAPAPPTAEAAGAAGDARAGAAVDAAPVELRVSKTSPPGATLYLDGRRLGGAPFRATFPRGGRHELRAEAKGYEPTTLALTLNADVTEADVTLERSPRTPARPQAPPHAGAAAGGDAHAGKHRPRSIDVDLPY